MLALIFAFVSFFGWAFGDIWGTIATRKGDENAATAGNLLFGFLIFSPIALFLLGDLSYATVFSFGMSFFLGVLYIVGLLAFYEALKLSTATIVGTISASFTALTVILSVLFFGEHLTSLEITAIIAIFIGVIISSIDFSELKTLSTVFNRGTLLAFVPLLCWGVYYAFIRIPMQTMGWFWPQYCTLLLLPFLFLFKRFRSRKLFKNKKVLWPIALSAALTFGADFSLNFAISQGHTSIAAPIAGSYPALFAVLAYYIFREKLSKQQLIGIVVTLCGIVALSVLGA